MINFKSAKFKGIGIWPTRLELCAGETGATISVECFSTIRGKTERRTAKVFGRKKGLESLAQVYIDDIHVMNVFFVGHTM